MSEKIVAPCCCQLGKVLMPLNFTGIQKFLKVKSWTRRRLRFFVYLFINSSRML